MWSALSKASLTKTLLSECEWMSMNPGATTRSRASIIRGARRPATSPTSVMRPSVMATSARTPGRAGAIDDEPAANEEVGHPLRSRPAPRSRRRATTRSLGEEPPAGDPS